MGRRRFGQRGNQRSEMKSLECVRCHRLIRLDEYQAHLPTCQGDTAPTPTPTLTPMPTPATAETQKTE